ncbi:helix-turn-helix domain-containing protein [Kitasatospora purpeofusca]|uniref:helix-turn-helix domain-containing protein n=1 Tax=Kitasatospora purpeofusca TaxID=67352 RepID=UPI0035E0D4A3
MSWDPVGDQYSSDPVKDSGAPVADWGDWPSVQTLGVFAPDGSRRYEVSYESRAHGPARISVTGCDANGELLSELQGEVLPADIPLIAQLLVRVTGAAPAGRPVPATATGTSTGTTTGTGTSVPGRRAPRAGESWGREETERLTAAHREGTGPAEIARRLGRSEKAVRWKLHDLGLADRPEDPAPGLFESAEPAPEPAYTVEEKQREHPNAYKRWTPEEEERLVTLCAAGMSLAELSQEFGRNEGAIASRLIKLDAQGPAAEEAWEYGG